jgi:hypothetical protein
LVQLSKKLAIALAGTLLAGLLGGVASGEKASFDKITGGGQIDVAADGTGPGNTIAFAALETPGGDRGQFQYVEHSTEGGGSTPLHGVVDCVNVSSPTEGRLSGLTTTGQTFWVRVFDGGASGPDMLDLSLDSDADCNGEPSDFTSHELGRGNITIHDEP